MKARWVAAALIASAVVSLAGASQQPAPNTDFKIVVIKGEGAVNIIQQKTAVAPVIEVRDRNNLPVAGVSVTFATGGGAASFGGASTLTATTNALGQATAAGFTPTAAGAVQINVTAAVQGQSITAAITQTNFATAAQAAAAGTGAAGGGGASGGASAGGAAGGGAGGGGLSLTTLGIVGGAVAAGGAVVATKTDLLDGIVGSDGASITLRGRVFARAVFGSGTCAGVRGEGSTSNTCYLDLVNGAVVSTSLDSTTATTGADGTFNLTTTIPEKGNECRTWTITITAAGLPTYSISTRGFATSNSTHRQDFAISPPTPEFMGSPGC